MNAIYTTCTVNHLSRAFSLLESVREYHPDVKFVICLVDTVDRNLLPDGSYDLIFAEEMGLPFFKGMCIKYSTLELNSALKPYFAKYILKQDAQVDKLVYLDSDILLFNKLELAYNALNEHSIVITPHSFSSIDTGFVFDDRDFLRSGIYNAGFFAVRRDPCAERFLDWWMGKLRNQGFFDPKRGMFAEQLWLNLVPLYFENVLILLHKGYNVAYWNIHERTIVKREEAFYVNDDTPLIFFHFSGAGLDCFEQDNPSKTQDRYTFTDRPDIIPVFELYINSLRKHSLPLFDSVYTITGKLKTRSRLVKFAVEFGRKIIKRLIYIK
jgi:hypothetical protein